MGEMKVVEGSASTTGTPWWAERTLVNGVFKGGGAKGIAYAGALDAMSRRQMWFGSVAGASAGAITASLIAAGYTPGEIESFVPDLLASIKYRRLAMVIGLGSSMFDGSALRSRLEALFAKRVGRDPDLTEPVTFTELYEKAGGISLYVVALDLSRSAPVVFSVHTTPDLSVSGAVLASSAIPAGFPSVRAIFKRGDDGTWAQRLVDGGAWSNLPRFVYYDPSFAAWVERLHPEISLNEERSRRTVCFALGVDDTSVIRPDVLTLSRTGYPQFDRGTTEEMGSGIWWCLGGLFSGWKLRALATAFLALIFVVALVNLDSSVESFLEVLPLSWETRLSLEPVVGAAYLIGVLTGFVLPVIMIAVSKPVGDVLVPAARAALAAGLGVAPWVGAADDDFLVRLDPGGLTTKGFSPRAEVVTDAVEDARQRTLRYIDGRLGGTRRAPDLQLEITQAHEAALRENDLRRRWTETAAERLARMTSSPGVPFPFALYRPRWMRRFGLFVIDHVYDYTPKGPLPVRSVVVVFLVVFGFGGAIGGALVAGWAVTSTTITWPERAVGLLFGLLTFLLVPGVGSIAAGWHQTVARGALPDVTRRAMWAGLVASCAVSTGLIVFGAQELMDFRYGHVDQGPIERVQIVAIGPGLKKSSDDVAFGSVTFAPVDDARHRDEFTARGMVWPDLVVGDRVFVRRDSGSPFFHIEDTPQPGGVIAIAMAISLLGAAVWPFRVLRRGKLLTSISG